MNQTIRARWESLQREWEALFAELDKYPHHVLNQQPGEDQWSAMQVVQHLLTSETLSLRYLQKKWNFQPDLASASFRTRWREWLLGTYLQFPFKFKAPKGVDGPSLPAESELKATRAAWKAVRTEMEAFLAKLPPEAFGREFYRHPIVGKITLAGMLKFFSAHFRRHRRQIHKALEAATTTTP